MRKMEASVEEFEGQMKIVVQIFGYTESFANFAL